MTLSASPVSPNQSPAIAAGDTTSAKEPLIWQACEIAKQELWTGIFTIVYDGRKALFKVCVPYVAHSQSDAFGCRDVPAVLSALIKDATEQLRNLLSSLPGDAIIIMETHGRGSAYANGNLSHREYIYWLRVLHPKTNESPSDQYIRCLTHLHDASPPTPFNDSNSYLQQCSLGLRTALDEWLQNIRNDLTPSSPGPTQ